MSTTTPSPAFSIPLTPDVTHDPSFSLPPQQTANNNNNNGGNNNSSGASSSLYLFTFLATLLLLLAVSCAIVIRSLIIRRRFNRAVEAALAAGLPPPGAPGTRARRDFGEKPVLSDVWISPGTEKWMSMMPVSVKVLSDQLQHLQVTNYQANNRGHVTSHDQRRGRTFLNRLPFFPRRRASPLLPTTGATPDSNSPVSSVMDTDKIARSTTTIDAKLQVSVLLAMPDSSRPQWPTIQSGLLSGDTSSQPFDDYSLKGKKKNPNNDYDDDEELPEVVFGVAELPWQLTASVPSAAPLAP